MASKSRKRRTKGIMMRGADGVLYFVPDHDLGVFRVPEKQAEVANADLDRLAAEGKGLVIAVKTTAQSHCIDMPQSGVGTRKPRS